MPTARTELELRMLHTLKRIAAYQSPDTMRRHSHRDWGCDYEECLEMAYENIQQEAKRAVKGVRAAKPDTPKPQRLIMGHYHPGDEA